MLTLLAAFVGPVAAASKTPRLSQDPASARATAARAAPHSAILAGGCFWTLQRVFDQVDGVTFTTTGFIGGTLRNPTYEQVTGGRTGHMEAVKIEFDPARVSFAQLLDIYWRNIDPTRVDQQFCDIGRQYNATVFYLDEAQRLMAEASRAALERSKPFSARIRTPIAPATEFFPAGDAHQRFWELQPDRYASYVRGCGREHRLSMLWGARR
ncbi:MAG: peptide-methionine (S)-S-oxide reductase MsrA [Burkholderiaceae bacterium]|nr:peptide-methionine (S)-S-oxide reductase MsrA [Burkholderiaceae bacterium]